MFASEWKRQFTIKLNTRANRLDDGRLDVVLMLNLEAKSGENTLFMVMLQQEGIFHIEATDEAQRREALGIACPDAPYPYARKTVDTLLVKGIFPLSDPDPAAHKEFANVVSAMKRATTAPWLPIGPPAAMRLGR